MARLSKAKAASKQNGARATNKGKAKSKQSVMVAKFSHNKRKGYTVSIVTEKRAKLPKGYVAYESEIKAKTLCIEKSQVAQSSPPDKSKITGNSSRMQRRWQRMQQNELKAIEVTKEDKNKDTPTKLARLKELCELRKLQWDVVD